VINIFLLLSLDNNDPDYSSFSESNINNALNEIGTGEGKSITLGIISCLMGLLGFNVFCVSYSKYLSERDFKSFENLFKSLEVYEKIRYGTFQDMCR